MSQTNYNKRRANLIKTIIAVHFDNKTEERKEGNKTFYAIFLYKFFLMHIARERKEKAVKEKCFYSFDISQDVHE